MYMNIHLSVLFLTDEYIYIILKINHELLLHGKQQPEHVVKIVFKNNVNSRSLRVIK